MVMGVWRPVINLSQLNQFILLSWFKMDMVASVFFLHQEENWMASIDLKDDYFQIYHEISQIFFEGYSLPVLCALAVGFSTTPRVFIGLFSQ